MPPPIPADPARAARLSMLLARHYWNQARRHLTGLVREIDQVPVVRAEAERLDLRVRAFLAEVEVRLQAAEAASLQGRA